MNIETLEVSSCSIEKLYILDITSVFNFFYISRGVNVFAYQHTQTNNAICKTLAVMVIYYLQGRLTFAGEPY